MKIMKIAFCIILTLILACCFALAIACGDDPSTGSGQADDNDSESASADDDTSSDDDADDDTDDDVNDDTDDDDDSIPAFEDPDPSDDIGIFIAITGDDTFPGTMEQPKRTIGAGITQADLEGKILFVARGTYNESIVATVSIYGGYDETDWLRDIQIHETKITSLFQEQTILIDATGRDLTLDGLHVEGAYSGFFASAVKATGDAVRLRRNVITSPDLFNPFGLAVSETVNLTVGAAILENNLILGGNVIGGTQEPGTYFTSTAVFISANNATVINNLIVAGDASDGFMSSVSMGMSLNCLHGAVINNTILSGQANNSLALFVNSLATTAVNNVIHCGESPDATTLSLKGGKITLLNNDLLGPTNGALVHSFGQDVHTAAALNACLWPGCEDAADNLSQDPLYVGNGDFHLTPASPCIDAGTDPQPWCSEIAASLDLDLEPRPSGSTWDIGMDEYFAGR
jgi:hypothetical protein